MEALVSACIKCYERLQDDTHTLNYMGVKGKLRPIILKNERYMQETRMFKAELQMEEIEDVEDMLDELDHEEEVAIKQFDIRNADQKDVIALSKDSKDRFAQRMKLKDRRADLRSMTKERENEEADAINIVFVALTAEEFAAMQNTEINEGTDEDTGAFTTEEEKKNDMVAARRDLAAAEPVVPFRTDSKGNLIGTST